MRCMSCGAQTRQVVSGGCGGFGSVSGCPSCDAVFHQTNGGFFSPLGGTAFAHDRDESFKELCYRTAKRIEPHVVTWKGSPNLGRWTWEEVGTYETHYFDTKPEAETWLAIYVKQLHDALPWPDCIRCKQKSQREFGSIYKCDACKLQCIGARGDRPATWCAPNAEGVMVEVEA